MSEGHANYPRPTSELECARILQYRYLAECLISERLLREQHDYIRANYPELTNLLPRPCGCTLVNNQKCSTYGCYNRNGGVACPAACGQFCLNNPWDNNLFVIGKKTYLKFVEGKGHGIFANEDLPYKTYIGEFTGRIHRNFYGLDVEAAAYAFRYEDLSLVIDPYRQGNGCSRINHSCDPNCVAKLVVHNTMLKVIIVVIRKIPKDIELTINYFWEHDNIQDAPECKCETAKCKGIIGYVNPKAIRNTETDFDEIVLDDPIEFVDFGRNTGTDLRRLVSSRPTNFLRRPENYQETHRFYPHDNVFALIPENGQLVITGARVVECYRNAHGIYIYVVRRTTPGTIDYHLPRWLLFHYQEDAVFRRDTMFSPQDRNFIIDYATPHANYSMGQHLEFELVLDYVQRFRSGNIPQTIMLRNSIQGPASLGAPSYRLEARKNCDRSKMGSALQRIGPPQSCQAKKTIAIPKSAIQTCVKMYARKSFGYIEDDHEDSECERLVILQPRNTYRVNRRRDFTETITHVEPVVMMRRLFDNAVEQVAILAFSRMPDDMGISFGNLMNLVRNDLEYHYYWAEPHQQRFLFFGHYRAATEAVSPGSMHLGWCSLCKKSHTFKTLEDQLAHFYKKHYIVPILYVCPKCKQKTNFPTEYRDHLTICDPTSASTLRADIMPFILDAYADFIARQDDQHDQVHVFEPGLPQLDPPEKTFGEISMNTKTGQPKSANVKVVPKSWKISKNGYEMDSWDNLTYAKDLDPTTQQPTKKRSLQKDKQQSSPISRKKHFTRRDPSQVEIEDNDQQSVIDISSTEGSIFYPESDKTLDDDEDDLLQEELQEDDQEEDDQEENQD